MGGAEALSLPRLFVYGTLRRGASAASLMDGAAHLGAARFRGRLYDLGAHPGAVASDDPDDVVHGELFAFPPREADACLARLDRYEGPAFRRERVRVVLAAGGLQESWIYLYAGELTGLPLIASGDYRPLRARRAAPADRRG